ncbi:MAG: hypothetical protein RLZZ200_3123 [Pseudomonadota bacterium]|jgi:hypothetical protein
MISTRTSALILVVVATAATRLLPHLPNVTPLTALALFGGAFFADRRLAFALPLAALALSDLALGALAGWKPMVVEAHLEVQYLAFALVVLSGFLLRGSPSLGRLAGGTLLGSTIFFVVSNFGVWAFGSMYPHSGEGLVACYVAGIPFFRNALLGDFGYAALLFGGFRLLEARFSTLRAPAAAHAG